MVSSIDLATSSVTGKVQGENVAVQKVRDPNKTTHRNARAVTNNLCQGKAQRSAPGTRL